jgi:carboxylesterase type B
MFIGGAASFGAERLMREDIVVVTIEYRVGALGKGSVGWPEFYTV